MVVGGCLVALGCSPEQTTTIPTEMRKVPKLNAGGSGEPPAKPAPANGAGAGQQKQKAGGGAKLD